MVMQEIRGPRSVPDTVPDELLAVYGSQARDAVRSRYTRRARLRLRFTGWLRGRDPWLLVAAGLLWTVMAVAVGAFVAMALLA